MRGINGNVSLTVIIFLFKHSPYFLITPRTYIHTYIHSTLHAHIRLLILVRSWTLKGLGCQSMVRNRVSSSIVSSSHSEHRLLILRLRGCCVFKDSMI